MTSFHHFTGNLLLLYLKHSYYDVAADLLAENAALTYKYLTPELYEFMEAQIMVQTSPEEVCIGELVGCVQGVCRVLVVGL